MRVDRAPAARAQVVDQVRRAATRARPRTPGSPAARSGARRPAISRITSGLTGDSTPSRNWTSEKPAAKASVATNAADRRHQLVRGVAQLAVAPGQVADADQQQRGDAERLQQRHVGDEAEQRSRRSHRPPGPPSRPTERATSGSRSALASNTVICADDRELEHHHDQDERRSSRSDGSGRLTFTASPARSRPHREPAGQDLDHVELAQVRERPQVHPLVELALVASRRASRGRSGCRAGTATRAATSASPDVTTVAPLRTARPFCTKSRIRSDGLPTVAFTSPFGPSGTSCADTPLRVVGDQRHARGVAATRRTPGPRGRRR